MKDLTDFNIQYVAYLHQVLLKKEEALKRQEFEYENVLAKLKEMGVNDLQEAKAHCLALEQEQQILLRKMKTYWDELRNNHPGFFE